MAGNFDAEQFIARHRSVFFVIIFALLLSACALGVFNYLSVRGRAKGLEGVEDIAFRVVQVSKEADKAAQKAIELVTPPKPEPVVGEDGTETTPDAPPDTPEFTAAKEKAEADKKAKIDAASAQALVDIEAFVGKSGVIGVRANILKADLLYRDKKYAEAAAAWNAAAEADKKAYTAPLSYANAAAACEDADDASGAQSYYEKAAAYDDYPMRTRVLFNWGRVQDEAGDYSGALATYKKLVDGHADDPWANIAQSRVLQLQAEGRAQ